jgi:hypothetical protein
LGGDFKIAERRYEWIYMDYPQGIITEPAKHAFAKSEL